MQPNQQNQQQFSNLDQFLINQCEIPPFDDLLLPTQQLFRNQQITIPLLKQQVIQSINNIQLNDATSSIYDSDLINNGIPPHHPTMYSTSNILLYDTQQFTTNQPVLTPLAYDLKRKELERIELSRKYNIPFVKIMVDNTNRNMKMIYHINGIDVDSDEYTNQQKLKLTTKPKSNTKPKAKPINTTVNPYGTRSSKQKQDSINLLSQSANIPTSASNSTSSSNSHQKIHQEMYLKHHHQ